MSDLTDAYDRAIGKSIEAGLFTAEEIASEKGKELLHAIQRDQRDRLIRLGIPGVVAPREYDYCENQVLYKLQKSFNDVAGLNDVRGVMQAAAEETLAAIAARGVSEKLVKTETAEPWNGDGPMRAAHNAVEEIFERKYLWMQCFANCEAPDFNYNIYFALQLRFLSNIPGFDAAAQQLEYDKKVVRNIHEVSKTPGLSDIRPILDAATEEALTCSGYKPAGRMSVPKTVQLRSKPAS